MNISCYITKYINKEQKKTAHTTHIHTTHKNKEMGK